MLSLDEAVAKVKELPLGSIVAVDGMPCSGKSTLAERIEEIIQGDILPFDDFFIPTSNWPANVKPDFPFPFFRTADFIKAVTELKEQGFTYYYQFDWDTMRLKSEPILCSRQDKTVLVEGTGILHPQICPYYNLRLYVESDWSSALPAVRKRDGDFFLKEWQTMFIPSDNIYLTTRPQARADFKVAGRGIGFHPSTHDKLANDAADVR